jgi:hypothetical protein
MTWQPILTAPRDGTVIFLCAYNNPFGWILGTGHWESYGNKIEGWITRGVGDHVADGLGLADPTHWQPLPEPPNSTPRQSPSRLISD